MRQPDFNNILSVLNRKKPSRPTLFEFFLNGPLYERLAGGEAINTNDELQYYRILITAFKNAGYDYAQFSASDFGFIMNKRDSKKSTSLNGQSLIFDEESFEKYEWNDPNNYSYDRLEFLKPLLPEGMKLIISSNYGLLENVISIVGYDTLCYMLFENPALVQEIFDNIGSRLLKYYEIALQYDSVGAIISNDDWGFNTQTMMSTEDMRKYVTPWHKKFVEAAHRYGRPAILHSCGNLQYLMEDIIEDIKFDGKHSYEDNIMPVEQAYDTYKGRLAILGGIDMDFICRSTPEQIKKRCLAMLERSAESGGYALGTGNSVPEYVPQENYLAMISCVNEY